MREHSLQVTFVNTNLQLQEMNTMRITPDNLLSEPIIPDCDCAEPGCAICDNEFRSKRLASDHFLESVRLYSSGWNRDFVTLSSELDRGEPGL